VLDCHELLIKARLSCL